MNHNHTEEIAKDMYNMYQSALSHAPKEKGWDDETPAVRQAWHHVADQALPIVGRHALQDVQNYLKDKATSSSGWKKALYWAGSIIAAGLALIGLSSLSGCGHDVSITPDHTEICKDGSCLVLDKDSQSITYRQNAPEPPSTAEQAPVVIKQEK